MHFKEASQVISSLTLKFEKHSYGVVSKLSCFRGQKISNLSANVEHVGLHCKYFIKHILKMRQLSELLASAKTLPRRMLAILIAAVKMRTTHSIGHPLFGSFK